MERKNGFAGGGNKRLTPSWERSIEKGETAGVFMREGGGDVINPTIQEEKTCLDPQPGKKRRLPRKARPTPEREGEEGKIAL